jgi:FAD/FMN-containing dehydrogenase
MTENVAPSRMPDESAIVGLRETLRGTMLLPDDPEYDATRGIWNGMIDRRPSVIVRCHGVADVIAAVNFARDHGLQVAVRGGGHGVAGHAVCDGGMMIDLSNMRAVRVDPTARRARVQGGATWGDVGCETTAFGLATPGGLISTTGISGLDVVRRHRLAPRYSGLMRRQCDIRRCTLCRNSN